MHSLSKPEKRYITLSVLFLCISSSAAALFQFVKGFIVAAAVEKNIRYVLYYAAAFLAVMALRSAGHGLYYYFVQRFSTLRVKDLREGLFYSWIEADYEDFYAIPEGEKLSFYQQQLPSLNMLYYFSFYGMGQIISETIIGCAALLYIHYRLACVGIAFILLPSLLPQLFKKLLDRRQSQFMETFHTHLGEFSDWQKGFEVIKNTGCEMWIKKQFGTTINRVIELQYRLSAANAFSQVFSTFTSHLSVIAVVFYGLYLLKTQELTVSTFIAAASFANELQGQVYYIAMYVNRFIMSRTIINSYKQLLVSCAKQEKHHMHPASTDIIFDHVSYGYTETPVLQDVCKTITQDGIHIICGESGSGKSTAMKLLLGLLKPHTGTLTLGGYEVCHAKNTADYISFLAQEPFFFDDTLQNNISLSKQYDRTALFELMRKLGLEQYASEDMLHTSFTHIESRFSGGELKRLSLVRTLLQDTPLIILDEPFANIDTENIEKIEQVLVQIRGKKICIITHLISETLKKHAVSVWEMNHAHRE